MSFSIGTLNFITQEDYQYLENGTRKLIQASLSKFCTKIELRINNFDTKISLYIRDNPEFDFATKKF